VDLSKVTIDSRESNRASRACVRFWFSVMYAMTDWLFGEGGGAEKSIVESVARASQTCMWWYA